MAITANRVAGFGGAKDSRFRPASLHHHLRHQQRTELGQQLLVGVRDGVAQNARLTDIAPCLFSATLYVTITCKKPQVAGVIPMIQQAALKYDVEVRENGRVELSVPFPAGAHLIVFIIQADDAFGDLLMAAESSLDFWDNPWDDEDWNTGSINSCQNLRASQFGNT